MIRTLILCAFLFVLSLNLFAGSGSPKPVSFLSTHFLTLIRKADSGFDLSVITAPHRKKICSCQILNLQSSNYTHNNVAVFAEKTNHGDYSRDFRTTKEVIEKEKKHLRRVFYDHLEVINHFSDNTDCQSLYKKLKGTDQSLVMYDILDADVRK